MPGAALGVSSGTAPLMPRGLQRGACQGASGVGTGSRPAPWGFSARSFPILGQGRDLCHMARTGPVTWFLP